jgi:uncharacterized protein
VRRIKISVDDLVVTAELDDSATARAIFDSLPLEGVANVWGDEIYFDIPVQLDSEPDARAEVEVGELGYWPVGAAFCIFFGPTPISTDETPRAYSPVNVFGRTLENAGIFKAVPQGATVHVSVVA